MRVLVKELYIASPTEIHDYEVKDIVFNDVKSIMQNPKGGVTIVTESDEYINIGASQYHYIQIF